MYSIQSVPITNNNQQSFPTKTQIRERLAQKLAFDWLLPKQSCIFFDIIGRQLIKKRAPPIDAPSGLSSLRMQLMTIDAHCYTILLPSVAVKDENAVCRNCGKMHLKMIFMLHATTLEGTNRYLHSIIDYICTNCAKEVCSNELRSAVDRKDICAAGRWVKTFATLQKIIQKPENVKSITTIELHILLLLMNNAVGFQVCNMQPFIDTFVQEKFAAEQIHLLQASEKSEKPVTNVISLSYVKPFLSCACCNCAIDDEELKLGVMSTVYYDTARVFAVPYYICSKPECEKNWQLDSFSQSRFTKLLTLHQSSMHECFRQSLQYLYFVGPKILGIEHNEFLNHWDNDEEADEIKNWSGLLMTVESDMLNKVFNLEKQHADANLAVETLKKLCRDPCIPRLDQCVKRCLCEICITKNLLFIEMLKKFEANRVSQGKDSQSRLELDAVVSEFCKLCTGVTLENYKPTKSHNRCWKNATNAVSSYEQDLNDQFRAWRLKSHKRVGKNEKNRCAQHYAQSIINNEQMDEFFDDTCSFMSPLF